MLALAATIPLLLGPIDPAQIQSTINKIITQLPSISTVNQNGTSQLQFNYYAPQFWELSQGTASSPLTTGGPAFKISRTEAVPVTQCAGSNAVDPECNPALSVYATGTASSQIQENAIAGFATGVAAVDEVGLIGIGVTQNGGTGTGTGAYLMGRRNANTGFDRGVEIRANNFGNASSYINNSVATSVAAWVTASGSASSGGGVLLGNAGQSFDVGFGALNGTVTGSVFRDDTSATTSMTVNGTHTYGVDTTGMTMNAGGAPFLAGLVTPATSAATCKTGSIEWDANFIYICTATNNWRRATLASF